MQASMLNILSALGLSGPDDTATCIAADAFDVLDPQLVLDAAREYKLHMDTPTDTLSITAETKFEIINRILELKHGMIIDQIKDVDCVAIEYSGGYRLEHMPAGF